MRQEDFDAAPRSDTAREAAPVAPGINPIASLAATGLRRLHRTAGNRAVARLVAGHRTARTVHAAPALPTPVPAGGAPSRAPQQDDEPTLYPLVSGWEEDRTRIYMDVDGSLRQVWTKKDGYLKNHTARYLDELIDPVTGKIEDPLFRTGSYMYCVPPNESRVMIGLRLALPDVHPDRQTGFTHANFVGGHNPLLQAAGEVHIQDGQIRWFDTQTGHYQTWPQSLRRVAKACLDSEIRPTAFHPKFKFDSVSYDIYDRATYRRFYTLDELKLTGREFRDLLRNVSAQAFRDKFVERLRGRAIQLGRRVPSTVRSVAGGFVRALTQVALDEAMDRFVYGPFIEAQIGALESVVQTKLTEEERQRELDDLLAKDGDQPIWINVTYKIAYPQVRHYDDRGQGSDVNVPPTVKVEKVEYSRTSTEHDPRQGTEIGWCNGRVDVTTVTVSHVVTPAELFGE
jgi:hypothetical protein